MKITSFLWRWTSRLVITARARVCLDDFQMATVTLSDAERSTLTLRDAQLGVVTLTDAVPTC